MSHEPTHAPHGAGQDPDDKLASSLSTAQFLVTGLVLAVVATLAYIAGNHSARGGHGGEASVAAHATIDVSKYLEPTPEILAQGKAAFMINCASCHGTTGHGDGAASTALNPKPRDFTSGYWRYGGGEARVTRTITEGSPGTGMASFIALPLEDRMALAHYVRSLGPKLQTDTPEDLTWLQPSGASKPGGEGVAAGGGVAEPPGPVIPIEKAMAALSEAEPQVGTASAAGAAQPGSDLYAERCAKCHGASGEGGVRVRMIGSAPYAYEVTRSLGDPKGDVISHYDHFEQLVLMGLPGYSMPGNGDLSRAELRDLYNYTQALRAKQESVGRSRS
ncbi:MAG: cytochrome c [Candidatus Eiseniibacteriota bacterium]